MTFLFNCLALREILVIITNLLLFWKSPMNGLFAELQRINLMNLHLRQEQTYDKKSVKRSIFIVGGHLTNLQLQVIVTYNSLFRGIL